MSLTIFKNLFKFLEAYAVATTFAQANHARNLAGFVK